MQLARHENNLSLKYEKIEVDSSISFYDKDIWDLRKISGKKYNSYKREYTINFSGISDKTLRGITKKFSKSILPRYSMSTLRNNIGFIKDFNKFIVINKITLTSVLTVLESGKIKHDAGKSGREYVGEQRNEIKS